MMSKLIAHGNNQNKQFKPQMYQVGEDRQEIIMNKLIIAIGIDQIVEIGECHLEVEVSTDKII